MPNTILCIEDNKDNIMLLKRILESEGFRLLQSNTGLEGIELAELFDVDVILLDINLPDIDGYEVARRIRTSPKPTMAKTPIIAISANALAGDDRKAILAGCNRYLTKPIDIQELRDAVDAYLPSVSAPIG